MQEPQRNREDEQYEKWGVTPPSRDMHGTEDEIAEKLAQKVKHGDWKQQGTLLTCYKCPFEHSHAIPVNFLLMGTDEEGLPILKKLGINKP